MLAGGGEWLPVMAYRCRGGALFQRWGEEAGPGDDCMAAALAPPGGVSQQGTLQ